MKVSFDYDDTLTTDKGKELLKRRQQQGDEIFIITARRRSVEVIDFARQYGINHIYFTAGADKWKTILELNIDVHYDNNAEQIKKIQENTNARGILI